MTVFRDVTNLAAGSQVNAVVGEVVRHSKVFAAWGEGDAHRTDRLLHNRLFKIVRSPDPQDALCLSCQTARGDPLPIGAKGHGLCHILESSVNGGNDLSRPAGKGVKGIAQTLASSST